MKIQHIVNLITKQWFHLDENYFVHTCGCDKPDGVSLCVTITENLELEGDLNELKRQISQKRKELGLLMEGTNIQK